jgi:hypothetical protein
MSLTRKTPEHPGPAYNLSKAAAATNEAEAAEAATEAAEVAEAAEAVEAVEAAGGGCCTVDIARSPRPGAARLDATNHVLFCSAAHVDARVGLRVTAQ